MMKINHFGYVLSTLAVFVGLVIPTPTFAQTISQEPRGNLYVYLLLDEDGDGEGDRGVGDFINVEVFGPLGADGGAQEYNDDTKLSEAIFNQLPFGNYFISAYLRTNFFDWKCEAGWKIDELVERVLIDCEKTGLRLFGLFIPMMIHSPFNAQVAVDGQDRLYLPQVGTD